MILDAGVLNGVSATQLSRAPHGRRFCDPRRHGKWLIAITDGPALLMHFGMTGGLHWARSGEQRHRHDRVVFTVDGGELRFRDMRKLQGITLAERPEDIRRVLGGLGPDAAGDARCPRCGATLARDRMAGRTTIWCPRCQPAR